MDRRRRPALLGLVAASLLVLALGPGAAHAAPQAAASYIVVLDATAGDPAALAGEHAAGYGIAVRFVYRHALRGYAGLLSPSAVRALSADPRVVYLERDGRMRAVTTQPNATWGLDRIDQRSLPLSTTFTYVKTGGGVKAYIVDTGMRFSHNEYGGRAVSGYDAIDGGSADDCHGHGTHVGGTVGGTTYGVAKQVSLVAVRVLNCAGSGSTSQVIAGVDWVTGDHQAGQPAVANMSLGGSVSTSLDNAVKASIADGVSYAIAAGNGNVLGQPINACNQSPARVAEAMTISATDATDTRASWANYGSCVDWFAPGVNVTSAWHTSNSATNTISGTSMATPHTAGVAALYLQGNPGASPATVRQALFDLATKDIVLKDKNTANDHLLYTNL